MRSAPSSSLLVVLLGLAAACAVGCGASPATTASADAAATPPTSAAPEAAALPAESAPSGPTPSGAAPSAPPSATASASPAAAPPETAKDPSPLVLDIAFGQKGGGTVEDATTAELRKVAEERLRSSSKMAVPSSKGVTAPRKVIATFMLEAPVENAKGLTIKMSLNGVSQEGRCPLFDLDQNLTMSGGAKASAADVLELRKAAVTSLLDKLEVTAPTVKPAANCTAYKK